MALEQTPAASVFGVVAIIDGVQRPRVDDQWVASSDLRISSTWREMSARPLAPGLPRRRRLSPPVSRPSIASRVRSERLTPRRAASCRRRLSSASGSLIVVRYMVVCQHTMCSRQMTAYGLDFSVIDRGFERNLYSARKAGWTYGALRSSAWSTLTAIVA